MADEQKDPPEEQTAGTEPETREVEDKSETEPEYRDLQPGELEADLRKHDQWLTTGKSSETQVDFSHTNLQEAVLTGANLQEAYLDHVNLRKAKLSKANLQEAHLSKANLQKADLTQANLQKAVLTQANLQGASLWVANLREASLIRADLRKAYFPYANLQEASLSEADLQEADLIGANLQKAVLTQANLQGASLLGANLQGASLTKANLQNAELGRATLRDTILQDADITRANGLQAQQLAGANVSGAKLDDNIESGFKDGLAVVQEASKNARKLFLTMLLACAYSLLTIATTTDLGLILNSGSSELPIIRTQVPIVWFYLAAPAFLLAVFVYFHLYMQRLWEGLGKLPAVFPDGRELDEKAYPWLLIGLCRAHVPLLRQAKRKWFLGLQNVVAIILAWAVTPLTLYMFWVRYVPKHHWWGTGLHLSLVALSAFFAFRFYRAAVDTLGGLARPTGLTDVYPRTLGAFAEYVGEKLRRVFGTPRLFFREQWDDIRARYRKWRTYAAWLTAAFIAWFGFLSMAAISGEERTPPIRAIFFRPYADLSGQDISQKPEGWEQGDTANVRGANLTGVDLRYGWLEGAFLAYADLTGANLQGADLTSADLQGAFLGRANLQGAKLSGANLQGAWLFRANLQDANLLVADLRGASLWEVWGRPKDVRSANLYDVRNLDALVEWLNQGAVCEDSHIVPLGEPGEARRAVHLDAVLTIDPTAMCGLGRIVRIR